MSLTAREWILLPKEEMEARKGELSPEECFKLRMELDMIHFTEKEKEEMTQEERERFLHPKESTPEEKAAEEKALEIEFRRLDTEDDYYMDIYKILKILEKSMDSEEFDKNSISKEQMGLSEIAWRSIMDMLADGYVDGIAISETEDGSYPPQVVLVQPKITLEGLQYLETDSDMKKAAFESKSILAAIRRMLPWRIRK